MNSTAYQSLLNPSCSGRQKIYQIKSVNIATNFNPQSKASSKKNRCYVTRCVESPDIQSTNTSTSPAFESSGIIVNERHFFRKDDLRAVAQRIINKGRRKLSPGEQSFMIALFNRHPDYIKKQLQNIELVSIESAPEPYDEYDCFYVTLKDGTKFDLSYDKCVVTDDGPMARFLSATRRAVQSTLQVVVEQELQPNMVCPICQHYLYANNSAVEHHPASLEQLCNEYIQKFEIDLNQVEYNLDQSAKFKQFEYQFSSSELEDSIVEYHIDNGQFRLISSDVYLYQPQVWFTKFDKVMDRAVDEVRQSKQKQQSIRDEKRQRGEYVWEGHQDQ